jgi:hypothetical protein
VQATGAFAEMLAADAEREDEPHFGSSGRFTAPRPEPTPPPAPPPFVIEPPPWSSTSAKASQHS